MATFKGTHITNFDSTPFDSTNSRQHGGVLKSAGDAFELADTADNDNAIVVKVPIDARIRSVQFACDDLGTAGTVDITFFTKSADGTYSEVADGLIANGIDVNSAAVSLTEYRYSVLDINTYNEAAWELAGLSARPDYAELYIGFTTDTGTTTAGTALLEVTYQE